MTLRKSISSGAELCPTRDVLDRVTDRWSILVLQTLEPGTIRFSVLKKMIGDIPQRTLAQTLRRLEESGFVSRQVFPTVPPKVAYTLTPLGCSFLIPLKMLINWAAQHHDDIRAARLVYIPPTTHEEL